MYRYYNCSKVTDAGTYIFRAVHGFNAIDPIWSDTTILVNIINAAPFLTVESAILLPSLQKVEARYHMQRLYRGKESFEERLMLIFEYDGKSHPALVIGRLQRMESDG